MLLLAKAILVEVFAVFKAMWSFTNLIKNIFQSAKMTKTTTMLMYAVKRE